MLFKKNTQAANSVPLSPAAKPMTAEQELEQLESQLDFLRKPKEGPKLKEPNRGPMHVVAGNAIPTPQAVKSLEELTPGEGAPVPEVEDGPQIQTQPEAAILPAEGIPSPQVVLPQGGIPSNQAILPSEMYAPADASVRQGNELPPNGPGAAPQPFINNAPMNGPQGFVNNAPVNAPQPSVQQPITQSAVPIAQPVPAPQAYAIQNTNANPVAPAIVPPQAIKNPNLIPPQQRQENVAPPVAPAPPQPQVLTPRPLQEVAAESAAAQAMAVAPAAENVEVQNVPGEVPEESVAPDGTIPRTQNKWGRQMDYKTAVVKAGNQSNTINFSSSPEQAENAVKPIPNPLPTPKKHIAKDMDFDLQPNNAMMHFDLVDMNGIDHFDIND